MALLNLVVVVVASGTFAGFLSNASAGPGNTISNAPESLGTTAPRSTIIAAANGALLASTWTGSVQTTSFNVTSTNYNLSSIFWGSTVSARSPLLANEGNLFNATPTQIVVWPGAGAGDLYDPFTNIIHRDGGGNGTPAITAESEFVAWCKSVHCEAIMQVPGEINDPAFAAEIVNYTERNLSFQPAYWEIGNEPQLWKHWNESWSAWLPVCGRHQVPAPGVCQLKSVPTNTSYAEEVSQYIPAMQAANNATPFRADPLKIIGIAVAARSGSGPGQYYGDWINATVEVDGPEIAGVAFHEYPAAGGTGIPANLTQFYAALTGGSGLPGRLIPTEEGIDRTITQYCKATCHAIPVFVTEIGTALSKRPDGALYSRGFSGALSMSAEITQAMALNVTNADLFAGVLGTNNSWMNFSGHIHPVYIAYTQIYNHLGPDAFPLNLSGFNQTLFGVGTLAPEDNDRSDLLIVNTNLTTAAAFHPKLPHYVPGSPVEVWYWNGTRTTAVSDGVVVPMVNAASPAPVAEFFPRGLPSAWTLPPQSLVLFEAFAGPAAPVTVSETGLPLNATTGETNTTWFVSPGDGSAVDASDTPSLTLFAPVGELKLLVPSTFPQGTVQSTRFTATSPRGIHVPSNGTTVGLDFFQQWKLSVGTEPGGAGSVTPPIQWANASVPLQLLAHPQYGYAVSEWVESEHIGEGATIVHLANGTNESSWTTITNISGPAPVTTIIPNGSIDERVWFDRSYPVTFYESGLPPGTNWSVALHVNWTSNETITTYHVFDRSSTSVYSNDTSIVKSANESVVIPSSSITDSITFDVANRTYGFTVANVSGYRPPDPVGSSVTVAGKAVLVFVNFTAKTPNGTKFPVTFDEVGLPSGTPWKITVRGNSTVSSESTLVLSGADSLTNGSYGYTATTTNSEYRAHPISDGFNVSGPGLVVKVIFEPVVYQVNWIESGLGNRTWHVVVAGQVVNCTGAWAIDRLPNGSYTYSIPGVSSYRPTPRAGSFSVSGFGLNVSVLFTQELFKVTFVSSNDPASATWSVQLGSHVCPDIAGSMVCAVPNGTSWFNVTPPTGYVANPSHGVVLVNSSSVTLAVSFALLGPSVDPPIWSLVLPALLTAGVIALVAWATFVLVGGRKRRRLGRKP